MFGYRSATSLPHSVRCAGPSWVASGHQSFVSATFPFTRLEKGRIALPDDSLSPAVSGTLWRRRLAGSVAGRFDDVPRGILCLWLLVLCSLLFWRARRHHQCHPGSGSTSAGLYVEIKIVSVFFVLCRIWVLK